ncbi:tripartite motif-containing protein 65-like isoform X2 [Carcharodon carcharias]|uniref:tripartite motif-containing protein 65-like isoform X2 n=1 Tax=Carcharodon carcharias TaxID=13397 RepID=UPI001B7E7526|nr:tripartite motif-containing protein 65-like isoform X2 [Carcharodon carcharias]
MAVLQSRELEDKLSCAICLDIFNDPVTTPCGHNFCMTCLQGHLDNQSPAGPYDCPACRTKFEQQPQPLYKNLLLDEVVQILKLRGPEPPHSEGELLGCQVHCKPLDLYCRKERQCICSACAVREHKGHDLVTVEDERLQREKELVAKHEEMERQVKKTEGLIDTLKQQKISIKDSASRAQTNYVNKFVTLKKELEEVQDKVIEYITNEELVALEQADIALARLEEKCTELRGIRLMLATTLKSNDSVQILKFPQEIHPVNKRQQDITLPPSDLAIENKLEGVKRALEQISILTHQNLQGIFRQASESLDIPGYRQLSFNPNTVHRFLTLSKDNRRVSHKATQKYPMHVERFEKEWQVLCCESFDTGQHYWEVQISSQWVYLGVTYKRISRRDKSSLIGRNNVSWALQLFSNSYSAWHDSQEVKLQPANYKRVGVHLDCTAGTLTFYGITNTMTLIHTFQSVFTEPLYPAVWVGDDVVATLCLLP